MSYLNNKNHVGWLTNKTHHMINMDLFRIQVQRMNFTQGTMTCLDTIKESHFQQADILPVILLMRLMQNSELFYID